MDGGKNKTNRDLQLARKRRALGQKQVAHLLGHRTVDQISRYESGSQLPSLKIALKLEIILGVPMRFLFKDLYSQLRSEVSEKQKTGGSFQQELPKMASDDRCSYTDLLASPHPSSEDLDNVRAHIIKMNNRFSQHLTARQPASFNS